MVKFGKKKSKIEWNIKKGLEDLRRILERSSEAVDTERVLMHVLGNVVFDLVFGKTWEEDDETWKRLLSYQEEGTKLIGIAGPINFLPFLRYVSPASSSDLRRMTQAFPGSSRSTGKYFVTSRRGLKTPIKYTKRSWRSTENRNRKRSPVTFWALSTGRCGGERRPTPETTPRSSLTF